MAKDDSANSIPELDSERGTSGPSPSVEDLLLASGSWTQTSFAIIQQEFRLEWGRVLHVLTPSADIALRGEACRSVI
jgi:hypothetical protein